MMRSLLRPHSAVMASATSCHRATLVGTGSAPRVTTMSDTTSASSHPLSLCFKPRSSMSPAPPPGASSSPSQLLISQLPSPSWNAAASSATALFTSKEDSCLNRSYPAALDSRVTAVTSASAQVDRCLDSSSTASSRISHCPVWPAVIMEASCPSLERMAECSVTRPSWMRTSVTGSLLSPALLSSASTPWMMSTLAAMSPTSLAHSGVLLLSIASAPSRSIPTVAPSGRDPTTPPSVLSSDAPPAVLPAVAAVAVAMRCGEEAAARSVAAAADGTSRSRRGATARMRPRIAHSPSWRWCAWDVTASVAAFTLLGWVYAKCE
mmetsp:Transcript_17950/g.45223  ORF Transcript_17950/g.45223 Transcript_17950/m.45223 type:complete len:322 (+) Transcript_17950:787-1752(+)